MTRGTVLVVDDDALIIDLLTSALEQAGYHVLTACDGAALHVAHERHPDVILLDLLMPGMDGAAVARHLRADPLTAAIPIVVMSAHDHLRSAVHQLPVNDQLRKPFTIPDLYTMVARWLKAT